MKERFIERLEEWITDLADTWGYEADELCDIFYRVADEADELNADFFREFEETTMDHDW